jgi:F-box and leucine-rich repeat protein GRR1
LVLFLETSLGGPTFLLKQNSDFPTKFQCTGCLNLDLDSHEMEGSNQCGCAADQSFTNLFKHFSALTSLDLFACKNLTSQGLVQIADNCPQLEELNIDEVNYLSDASLNHLIDRLGGRLRQLWIDGETLTDDSFGNLGQLAPRLELLSISFADNMGSRGMGAIARLANLEWLKVRRANQLQAEDFVRAFGGGQLKKLIYLDLSECSTLSDAGLMAVAGNCPGLSTLNLCWCWELTDQSLSFIVSCCKLLISLNLCGVVR